MRAPAILRSIVLMFALAGPALAADTTPFFRMGDPFPLPVSTTATQYQIAQPTGSTSYRLCNPGIVDIRIKTVALMSSTVTATTGTLFLARTCEVVASSPPLTSPRIISILAVGDPGPNPRAPELLYGTGQ